MATSEKMVEVVVARNRTIHDSINTGTKEKPEIVTVLASAGQKVKLPESEAKRLRGLGFLVPEKVEEVSRDGVQISGGQVSISESE